MGAVSGSKNHLADQSAAGNHPGLLNSRFGYVSISRASREATLFADDMPKLSGPCAG
jgi:hypothetical protein